MAEAAVVNASPVIFLAGAGRLELLREAGDTVVVPSAVAREIGAHGPAEPAARALADAPWLEVVDAPEVPPRVLRWDLGAGESAVLAWALAHAGCQAVVDDLAARRCAAALGVPVRGTLGLVLVAKRRGRIPAARPVVEELRRGGMYLSDAVLDAALTLVGE